MKKLEEIKILDKLNDLRIKRAKFLSKINKQIDKKQTELEIMCTHSEEMTREENYEGGYDHVAEYNKITQCAICGKELNRETTHGGYA